MTFRKPSYRVGAALLVLLASLSLNGCAGMQGKTAPAEITRNENGFTIEESARVGLGLRGDFDKARTALEADDLDLALRLLTEITQAAPHFTAAQINLSIAHQRSEDFKAAEAALLSALEINPKHPVVLNELGIVQRRSGRFDDAKASFEKALSLQPQFHYARKNLAVLCDLFLEDAACALESYRLYQELNPEDEAAAIWIADLENRFAAEGR